MITDSDRTLARMVLAKIAASDHRQRQGDPLIVEAWAEQLAHAGLGDHRAALDAVRDHYAQAGVGLMLAGDLVARMRAMRRDRADRETEEERQLRYAWIDTKAAADRRPAAIVAGPLRERPELGAAIRRMGNRWSA